MDGKFLLLCVASMMVMESQAHYFDKRKLLFPQGIYDGESCDYEVLARLPAQCSPRATEIDRVEMVGACYLITPPNSGGSVPFGIFPPSYRLDSPLYELSTELMTKAFSDCAMAKMIHNGCFSMKTSENFIESWSTYSTIEEYTELIGLDIGIDLEYSKKNMSGISVKASASYVNQQSYEMTQTMRRAGAKVGWYESTHYLELDESCIAENLSDEYVDFFYEFLNSPDYEFMQWIETGSPVIDFIKKGTLIPTKWEFGVSIMSSIDVVYEATSSETSKEIGTALSLGVEAAYKNYSMGFSTSFKDSFKSTTSAKKMKVEINAVDQQYGPCDVTEIFRSPYPQEGGKYAFNRCQGAVIADHDYFGRVPSPTRVLKVQTILDALRDDPVLGPRVDVKGPYFVAAMNVYHGVCKCNDGSTSSYTCQLADGTTLYSDVASGGCKTYEWWLRDDAKYQTNRVLIEKAATPQ